MVITLSAIIGYLLYVIYKLNKTQAKNNKDILYYKKAQRGICTIAEELSCKRVKVTNNGYRKLMIKILNPEFTTMEHKYIVYEYNSDEESNTLEFVNMNKFKTYESAREFVKKY